MLKVGLSGCNGTMGRILNELLHEEENTQVVFGIDLDLTRCENDYPVFKSPQEVNVPCDVVIDFSKPENIDALIDYCLSTETPAVIATTGLIEFRFSVQGIRR